MDITHLLDFRVILIAAFSIMMYYSGIQLLRNSSSVDHKKYAAFMLIIATVFGLFTIGILIDNYFVAFIPFFAFIGGSLMWSGIKEIRETHDIKADGHITDMLYDDEEETYTLRFWVQEMNDYYFVDGIYSKDDYVMGKKYELYISKKDHRAYLKKYGSHKDGMIFILLGLVPFAIIIAAILFSLNNT